MLRQNSSSRRTKLWKWLGWLMCLVSLLAAFGVQGQSVKAADITSQITGISGSDALYNGKKVTPSDVSKWSKWSTYELTYNFRINSGTKVTKGDTATLNLPAGVTFHDDQNFEIKSKNDDQLIGTFKAAAGSSSGTITFSSYFSTHNNGMVGTIDIPVIGSVDGNHNNSNGNSNIAKNGWAFNGYWLDGTKYGMDANGRYQYVAWKAQINPKKLSLKNVVIADTLQNPTSQELLPKTLAVQYVNGETASSSDYTVSNLSPTGFSLTWNGILNKTINVLYLAKVTDSGYKTSGAEVTLNNQIKLTADIKGAGGGSDGHISENTGTANAHINLGGSGTGGGTNFKINVKKQWQGVPTNITPPAIRAELYENGQPTNKMVTLDHSNNYAASFDNLNEYDANNQKITYTVGEAKVPTGYTNLTASPQPVGQNNTVVLTNKRNAPQPQPQTTNIQINKVWEGLPSGTTPPSVIAELYRNGQATDTTVTLDRNNGYSAAIKDLPVTDKAGKSITYTVAEKDVPSGYTAITSGPQTVNNGRVTLRNRYISKTPVNPNHPNVPDTPVVPNPPVTPDTPSTPNQPVTPGTPVTPGESTPPTTPDTPKQARYPKTITTPDLATPSESATSSNSSTKQPVLMKKRDDGRTVTPVVKHADYGDRRSAKLPQTGERQSRDLGLMALGLIMLGLWGVAKLISRRKQE